MKILDVGLVCSSYISEIIKATSNLLPDLTYKTQNIKKKVIILGYGPVWLK